MRWPRGKYNGQRIVGVSITAAVDVTWWSLGLPSFKYGTCLSLGPVHIWFNGRYR